MSQATQAAPPPPPAPTIPPTPQPTASSSSSSTTTPKQQPPATDAPRHPPTAKRPSLPRRLLNRYLHQLSTRPLRTKMITSTCLFLAADTMAQFGIEGRRLPWTPAPEPDVVVEEGTLSRRSGDASAAAATTAPEANTEWDPVRAARLMFYGGTIFAPLAHNWLNFLQKIQLSSKFKTIAARIVIDQGVWGPFIVCLFWTSNGILEGKSLPEVRDKLKLAFIPVYTKSLMVFGPTSAVSFTFVPLQHRLLVGQTVGLGWNTYLSYTNHVNNLRLAAAAKAVSAAEGREAERDAAQEDVGTAKAEVKKEQEALEKARMRKERILAGQGGGSTGVGTRMGH